MRTTSLRLIVLAVVCGSGLVLARAQETPETLTGGEYRCQIAFGKALIDLSIETGECLVTCRTSPWGQCSLFLPDAITADCLSRARADADIRVLRRCAGSDCPECYGGGGDCPSYASPAFSQATSLIDMAVSVLYCNDALSADGLTRDEQRCQSGLSRASGQFIEELGRCFQRCAERVRHGTTQFSSCESAFLDTPAFDDRTQRCVEAARMGLLAACDRRCEDPPDCFGLSCMGAAAILESQLLGFQSTTSCEDVPPPECGDGQVTGGEVCDPSAFPNGCPPDLESAS